jgi:hypothetical protein
LGRAALQAASCKLQAKVFLDNFKDNEIPCHDCGIEDAFSLRESASSLQLVANLVFQLNNAFSIPHDTLETLFLPFV